MRVRLLPSRWLNPVASAGPPRRLRRRSGLLLASRPALRPPARDDGAEVRAVRAAYHRSRSPVGVRLGAGLGGQARQSRHERSVGALDDPAGVHVGRVRHRCRDAGEAIPDQGRRVVVAGHRSADKVDVHPSGCEKADRRAGVRFVPIGEGGAGQSLSVRAVRTGRVVHAPKDQYCCLGRRVGEVATHVGQPVAHGGAGEHLVLQRRATGRRSGQRTTRPRSPKRSSRRTG